LVGTGALLEVRFPTGRTDVAFTMAKLEGAPMASCNSVQIEVDYRSYPELDADLQRFTFDDEHSRLRDNVAAHTIEGSQDVQTFQMVLGQGVRGPLPLDFKGVGVRYVQTMSIKEGHFREFMDAMNDLAEFHAKAGLSQVKVWAVLR
jgi:hypothetical protein